MREVWVEVDGSRLFVVEDGEGFPLVMLHGGMASHVAVLPAVGSLSGRYRVITPDQRGSGRSHCGAPLTFERLAGDLEALLDQLGVDRAVVGGMSSGTGLAVHFALRYPERTRALILLQPVYGGEEHEYTEAQQAIFAGMDSVASRAIDEGVEVLRPLYERLPSPRREKALAMLEGFDAASVVATSRFIASGAQPFGAVVELESLAMPTLLVRGDDAIHPAAVSDLHAARIPDCTVLPASTEDLAGAIETFLVERCGG